MKNDSEYLAQLEKDVVLAYKKLKSYVYHENVSLRLRMDVARFETTEIDEKLSTIALDLFEYENNSKSLDAYLNKIRCSLYPKYFESENIDTREEFYFSNLNKQKNYTISGSKSVTAFIECPVEIHIMCVLWIMRIGESLDDELSSSCYANRLQRDSDNEFSTSSIKLFKRYYDNYNSWRDDAIKKAKSLHKLNLDVAILNLDIQSYYNSVDIDVRSLKAHKPDAWLNDALFKVHDVYRKVLVKLDLIDDPRKKILPIGLLSSNILSNYYLRKLDAAVTSTIKPEFYGRYVDDILLVFSNPRINPTAKSPATEFILETLCNAKNWKSPKEVQISRVRKSNEFQIRINTNSLKFQLSKVKLYHFFSSESINVLEEFENEIKRNSSEFKFQPESEEIFESFEKSSYSISYSDTINKLRSIEGFNTNKFGASKHLSKLITATKFVGSLDKEKMEEINFRIREFFTGRRALELNSLWEKVFTFYVINKAKDDLISYSKEIIQTVLNIQFKINGKVNAELTKTIKSTLLDHLGNCFAMAAALDGNFFTKSVIDGVRESNGKGIVSQHLKDITLPNIQNRASKLIDSNLFRHNYSFYPLFNYCNQYETFSYVNWMNFNEADYEISTHKIKFSPRFIHFHELELFYSLKNWFGKFQKSELEEYTKTSFPLLKIGTCNSITSRAIQIAIRSNFLSSLNLRRVRITKL